MELVNEDETIGIELAGTVSSMQLRTAAWYGDEIIRLDFPADWEICEKWPATPLPLTDEQITASLENPVGGHTTQERQDLDGRWHARQSTDRCHVKEGGH